MVGLLPPCPVPLGPVGLNKMICNILLLASRARSRSLALCLGLCCSSDGMECNGVLVDPATVGDHRSRDHGPRGRPKSVQTNMYSNQAMRWIKVDLHSLRDRTDDDGSDGDGHRAHERAFKGGKTLHAPQGSPHHSARKSAEDEATTTAAANTPKKKYK